MKEMFEEYANSNFKLWIKRIFVFLAAVVMVIATIMGAMAFSIDENDNFYITKDSQLEGAFIISEFQPDITLKSNMEWVSLSKDEYISEKSAQGVRLIDETYVFSYWIDIPENADIGIYRGTIEVKNGNEIQYLNIKLNVQNKLVNTITKGFHKPATRIPLIIGGVIILCILFLLTFRRAKNGSKR